MKFISLLILLLASFCIFKFGNCNHNLSFKKGSPIIGVSKGYLNGKLFNSRQNRLYFGFRGIPFAETPMRFKDPEEITKWFGFKNAMNFGSPCPQLSKEMNKVIGDEDCLYLNVYFPKDIKYENLVPVMVYIDGIEFLQGGGHNFGPDYFMDEDIILVTLNYRMGALGFLNTEDEEVTGNMGMKDIVLALKWVQKEIKIFGGDPNNVTIFGHGSGGSAVHYMILSPMTKDLFQYAISQSGTALNPSAFYNNPSKSARKLGEILNCSIDDSSHTRNIVKCLQSKTTNEIVTAQHQSHWSLGEIYRFTPSVDKYSTKKFLPNTPYNLIVKGQFAYVPWIVGGNDDEGLFITQEIMGNPEFQKRLKYEWTTVAPNLLEYRNSVPTHEMDNISKQIWTTYFNDSKEITTKTLGNLLSDRHFWLGFKTAAFYHSKISKAFTYVFGSTNNGDLQSLLFPQNNQSRVETRSIDENFSKGFIKLWTSFAKTGKPTQTWGPELEWGHLPPSRIGIIAPLKWYYIDNETKKLSDESEKLYFWHTLPLNEFIISDTKPIKDEF